MSDYSDIGQAILDVWVGAIPGGDPANSSLNFVAFDSITPGQMPYVLPIEAAEQSTELVAVQEGRVLTFTFAQVSEGDDTVSMWADLDAVREALYADRTLGGLVDKLFVPARAVPAVATDNRMLGTIDVQVEWTQ